MDEPSKDASLCMSSVGPSGAVSTGGGTGTISRVEVAKKGKTGHLKLLFVLIAILIALFSALTVYLLSVKPALLDYF